MKYEIKKIKIPFCMDKLIEFEGSMRCQIIDADIDSNELYEPDRLACCSLGVIPTFNNCRFVVNITVVESWDERSFNYPRKMGSTDIYPVITQEVVILTHGSDFEYPSRNYATLSNVGKFKIGTMDHYLFQVRHETI